MRKFEGMKKLLSILLCVLMLAQYVPTTAFAADEDWHIQDGVLFVDGDLTGLPDESYSSIIVNPGGELRLGSENVDFPVTNNGTISGGEFSGTVTNNAMIKGGTFKHIGKVYNNNSGEIVGGTFNCDVESSGTISGGTFNGSVTNNGTVSGSLDGSDKGSYATFGDVVYNNGTIEMARFEGNAYIFPGTNNPVSVIHSVDGKDKALPLGAELPDALGPAGTGNAWYCGGTQVVGGGVPMNYTQYTKNPVYTVTIDPDIQNGTVTASHVVAAEDETVTLNVIPLYTGYGLATLDVTDGSDNSVKCDQDPINSTKYTFTMPASAVTVTAVFQPTYTVTFNVNGGTGNSFEKTTFVDSRVEAPEAAPTHLKGMEFVGWYTSSDSGATLDNLWDFETPVTGDITLYAKWILPQSPDFSWLLDYDTNSSGTSEEYGYSYEWKVENDENDTHTFVLTLNGKGTSGEDIDKVTLPGNNGYDELNITLNSIAETTISYITLGSLEGGSYAGNFYDKITFSGLDSAKLTIDEMYLQGTNGSIIEVAKDANVTVNDPYGMNFGQSGGTDSTLIVNGKLHAYGTYCGKLYVGSTGEFISNAQIRLNGMVGSNPAHDTLVIKDGGKLEAYDDEAALLITVTPDYKDGEPVWPDLTDVVSILEGYLVYPYRVAWVEQEEGGYSGIITIGDNVEPPKYQYDAESNKEIIFFAAKSLRLPMSGVTLRYDTNDGTGTAPTAQTMAAGTEVTVAEKPADLTRTGYTFDGWNTKADGSGTTYSAGNPITVSENMTLYAKWNANTYDATFHANGGAWADGETTKTVPTAFDSAITEPAAPTRAGYTFNGWSPEVGNMTKVDGMTFNAQWEINQYTITFDTDGGSDVAAITQDYNSAVTAPAAPTKEGYTFKGWDPKIPATMPAEDVTITAQWTANTYEAAFNANGGAWADGETTKTVPTAFDSAIVKPADPTRTGYTFNGWYPEVGNMTNVDGMTFNAQWEINQYTITFDTDGGSDVAAITQDYNSAVTAPAAPTKEGYTFAGWNAEIPATMPAENVTITARWKINQYTVTIPEEQDGYTLSVDTQNPNWHEDVTLTFALEPGYSETGSFAVYVNDRSITLNENGKYTVSNVESDVDIRVVGVADVTAPTATVEVSTNTWNTFLNNITFGLFFKETQTVTITAEDVNTGSGIRNIYYYLSDSELTLDEVKAIILPNILADGDRVWSFYERPFNIDPDAKYIIYALAVDKAGNAVYVNSDGIVLDATAPAITGIENGGTYYGDTTFKANDTYFKSATVDGKEVSLTEGEYTIAADNKEHTIIAADKAGNTTEYKITVYKIYTVTYEADGKTVKTQTVEYGKDAIAPEIPAKTGYDQTTPVWEKDGKNITADTTINAVYTVNKYTVTYAADGETVDTETVEHGASATKNPAVPAKEGYTGEWEKAATNVTSDTTINAVYTVNKYTVKYVVDGETVDTQTVEHGKDAIAPEIPAKTGYDQTAPAWDKDGKNITADTTINAVYTVNKYTVTYAADGETVDTETVEHGASATKNPAVPAKEGYMGEWEKAATNVTSDTTINAVYTVSKYTVNYVVDGETVKTQTVEHGKNAAAPEIPAKTGYDQTAPAWDKDGKNITADTTITAVYTINKYTVTYVADGETVDTETVEHGASATKNPAVPAKEGYMGEWEKAATNVTSDTTINAVYTVSKYTVNYVVDGETVKTQTVEHGKNAAAPEIPAKTGYDQTAPAWDKDGKNITADTTITAVYTINKYTVTYVADGKTVETQTVEHGKDAAAPKVPAKTGYTGKWDEDGKNITADTIITAVYTINKYTVTYVADGKTVDTQTVEYGKDATAPKIPAKSGYTAKWDKNGKNITSDTTITAVYKVIPASDSPATGDQSNILLWTSVLFGSVLALALIVIIGKKIAYKGKYVEN